MSLNKELSQRVTENELDLYFAFNMEFVQVQILQFITNCI
jgi:predicted transport protein